MTMNSSGSVPVAGTVQLPRSSVRFGMCQTVACVRANTAWSYDRMALSRVLYGWEELLCDLFKLLARGKGRKYS